MRNDLSPSLYLSRATPALSCRITTKPQKCSESSAASSLRFTDLPTTERAAITSRKAIGLVWESRLTPPPRPEWVVTHPSPSQLYVKRLTPNALRHVNIGTS